MKYSEILKAVLFMDDVRNQGMITIPAEKENGFEIVDILDDFFGYVDIDKSWIEGIEWGKTYFFSHAPLCSEETLNNPNPEQSCYPCPYIIYLTNGKEINLYDVED